MMRWFWLCFVLMGLVYGAMVVWSLPAVSAAAGGLAPFDLRLGGYSEEEARAFLTALTPEGRAFYTDVQHRLDLIYPPLLGLTLTLGFHLLFAQPWNVILSLVSLSAVAADYLENFFVGEMLAVAPADLDTALIATASFWTLVKAGVSTAAMTAFLGGALWAGWRRWRR